MTGTLHASAGGRADIAYKEETPAEPYSKKRKVPMLSASVEAGASFSIPARRSRPSSASSRCQPDTAFVQQAPAALRADSFRALPECELAQLQNPVPVLGQDSALSSDARQATTVEREQLQLVRTRCGQAPITCAANPLATEGALVPPLQQSVSTSVLLAAAAVDDGPTHSQDVEAQASSLQPQRGRFMAMLGFH